MFTARHWKLAENLFSPLATIEELTNQISSSTASVTDEIPAIRVLNRLLQKTTLIDPFLALAAWTNHQAPCTNVDSWWLFCAAGNIGDDKRSKLAVKMQRCCLRGKGKKKIEVWTLYTPPPSSLPYTRPQKTTSAYIKLQIDKYRWTSYKEVLQDFIVFVSWSAIDLVTCLLIERK